MLQVSLMVQWHENSLLDTVGKGKQELTLADVNRLNMLELLMSFDVRNQICQRNAKLWFVPEYVDDSN